MDRTFLLLGSLFGFLGVALGAFGAHGLRSRLSPEMLVVFETGVRYEMYHAFALLIVAAAMLVVDHAAARPRRSARWCGTIWVSPRSSVDRAADF